MSPKISRRPSRASRPSRAARASIPPTPAAAPREVVRCVGAADFLSALPHLTGFTASDSIFVVLFRGKRAENSMRFDLPPADDAQATESLLDLLSTLVCREVSRLGGSDPAVVITSSQSFEECSGAPSRYLAQQIKRRLARNRVRLRELCCVGSDGWVSLLDRRAPRLGRPLSEIQSSAVGLNMAVHGEASPSLEELGRLPELSPSEVSEIAAHLDAFTLPGLGTPLPSPRPGTLSASDQSDASDSSVVSGSSDASDAGLVDEACSAETTAVIRHLFPGVETPEDTSALAMILETAMLAEELVAYAGGSDQIAGPDPAECPGPAGDGVAETPVPPAMIAELIALAQDHRHWVTIAITLVTRPWFPCSLAADAGAHTFFNLPVDAGPRSHDQMNVTNVIAGMPSDSRARERMKAVLPTLSRACAAAPPSHQAALFALRAWSWCMRGLQSLASQDLDRAHEQED